MLTRILQVAFFLSLPFAPVQAAADLLPRAGVDYEILPAPHIPYAKGNFEVAEVFSYACTHCSAFQPLVDAWLRSKPSSVRWQYVPAAFGGPGDIFARAYFAADALGERERTHDAVFKAIFVDKAIRTAAPDEIADMYAKLGVDRARFVQAMKSVGVTAQLRRSHEFILRTGVQRTPTLVLNGKYRLNVTKDRGQQGMLATLDFLLAKEGLKAMPEAAL